MRFPGTQYCVPSFGRPGAFLFEVYGCPAGLDNFNQGDDQNVLYTMKKMIEIVLCIIYSTFMLFEIGAEIKKERKRRKLSQQTVASDLGMSRTTISLIESGTVQDIGVRKLIRLLEYLGRELRVRQAGMPPTLDELREET